MRFEATRSLNLGQDDGNHGVERGVPGRAYLVVVASYFSLLVTVFAVFQFGFLALGPRISPKVEVTSLYGILPGSFTSFAQIPLIPFYNASTIGATSFAVRFRLNVTSFVAGAFTSSNGADMFIFPSDSGSSFWESIHQGLNKAAGFTFTTGAAESGRFQRHAGRDYMDAGRD